MILSLTAENSDHLADDEYLEISSEKIQSIVDQIDEKSPKDIYDRIHKTLMKIDELMDYDLSMLASDSLNQPIKASKIIERKSGVCGHYSLLATSLLRAQGIPTRIAGGYVISSDPPEAHAWIEINVNGKNWVPIEPQAGVLLPLKNRIYVPLKTTSLRRDENGNLMKGLFVPTRLSQLKITPF